ncbi:DUF4347 domain-containing protein, partial [Spongorhabdus nitratireducens]
MAGIFGRRNKKAAVKKSNLIFEALENRILLSADLPVDSSEREAAEKPQTVLERPLDLPEVQIPTVETSALVVSNELATVEGQVEEVIAQESTVQEGGAIQLSPSDMYLAERLMAAEIVIVDSQIPEFESVLAELFNKTTPVVQSSEVGVDTTASVSPEKVSEDTETQQHKNLVSSDLLDKTIAEQVALNADRQVKIFVLDQNRDGIEQITSILDTFEQVSALHLLTHGAAGQMRLGNSQVTSKQLRSQQELLTRWGQALTPGADLLLYGCNVADGAVGIDFVESLSRLTGADVAASTDTTGNTNGADWDLEYTAGIVETSAFVSSSMVGTLAEKTGTEKADTITSTGSADTLKGLQGDDTYKFSNGFGKDTVTEEKGQGNDTLDFSSVTADLTITIKKNNTVVVSDGTNTVTARNVENIKGGSGNDTFVVERGAKLPGWIDGGGGTKNILTYTSSRSYTGSVKVDLSGSKDKATAIDGFKAGSVLNIQEFVGGSAADVLQGGTQNDKLDGGKGDDRLSGGSGNDTLFGGAGNDVLDGEAGTDTLEGGAGKDILKTGAGDTLKGGSDDDTYRFEDNNWNGVKVREESGEGKDLLDFSGISKDLNFDVNDLTSSGLTVTEGSNTASGITHIEKIKTGTGNNTFTFHNNWSAGLVIEASTAASVTLDFSAVTSELTFTIRKDGSVVVTDSNGHKLTAASVNNIKGGQGDNIYRFEKGAELDGDLTGGSGSNIVDYSLAGTIVNLDLETIKELPGVKGTFSGIDSIIAGKKNDYIKGTDGQNSLDGGRGDDYLYGGDASDELKGSDGNDRLVGDAGNDTLDGGRGDDSYFFSGDWGQDTVETGGGSDTISFGGADAEVAKGDLPAMDAIAAVTKDLALVFNSDGSLRINDSSVTANTVTVGQNSLSDIDTIIGGSAENRYTFRDNWGNGAATSILLDDTQSSKGTLDFSGVTSDLKFTVSTEQGVTTVVVTTVVNGKVYTVTAKGVENLIGGTGKNHFVFEKGAVLAGNITGFSGSGSALLDFSGYGEGIKADLSTGTVKTAQDQLIVAGGVSDISDLTGTDYADELIGDDGDNTLIGGKGNDTLKGGAGNDTYLFDKEWGQLSTANPLGQKDVIVDTAGENVIDLSGVNQSLDFLFNDGGSNGDKLTVKAELATGISNQLSLEGVKADGEDWSLIAGAKDDHFYIADQVDFAGTIDGGEGINTLDYFNGTDGTGANAFKQGVTVDLEAGTATALSGIKNIRNVYGSRSINEADVLIGDDNDNLFIVGDWVTGSISDQITGNGGSDTVSFAGFTDPAFGITADLAEKKAEASGKLIATLEGIENLIGGAGNDTLIGDDADNILEGGGGDDALTGNGGDDTYRFQENWGTDTITESSGEGKDTLDFTAIKQALTFDKGRAGNDTAIALTDALKNDVVVTDEQGNKVTTGFQVEKFDGVKDSDTLTQANIKLGVDEQDKLIAALEALKTWADSIYSGYGKFDELLDLKLPLVGGKLGDLFTTEEFTKDKFASVIGNQLQPMIDELKLLFWSAKDATENNGDESSTDQLFAIKVGGEQAFTISHNTRLLEFSASLLLFENTQSTGLDLGGALSAIPGFDLDLEPQVRNSLRFDFGFGLLPEDPAAPDENLEFHIAAPGLIFETRIFDDAIVAGLNLGLVSASVGGTVDNVEHKGLLSLVGDVRLGTDADLRADDLDPAKINDVLDVSLAKNAGINVELPVIVNTDSLNFSLPNLPVIRLTTPDLPTLPGLPGIADFFGDIKWEFPDLSELLNLASLSLGDLINMLDTAFDALFDGFAFDVKLPGLDLTLDQLLGKIPGFDFDGIEAFFDGILEKLKGFDLDLGLQGLSNWLNAQIKGMLPDIWPDWALPKFDFGFDGFNLGIDLDFDFDLARLLPDMSLPELALPLDIDLADLIPSLGVAGVTLAGDGELVVNASLDIDLELDFAVQDYAKQLLLNQTPKLLDYAYIGDDSKVELEASAGGVDLDAEASMAATVNGKKLEVGFWVEDGTALVEAAAMVGLQQHSQGRYQLSQFLTPTGKKNSIAVDVSGEANLDLPLFLGTPTLPVGGSLEDLNADGFADNVLHIGTDFEPGNIGPLEVITPDLLGGFSLMNFLNDPTIFLKGLESIFDNLESVFTDQLGKLGLPLVGDVLKDAGAFVDTLKQKLLGVADAAGKYLQPDGMPEIPSFNGVDFSSLSDLLDYADLDLALQSPDFEDFRNWLDKAGLGFKLQNPGFYGDYVIDLIRKELFDALGDYLQVGDTDGDGLPVFDQQGKLIYRDVQTPEDIQLKLTPNGELTFNVLLAGSVFEGLGDYKERLDTDDIDQDGDTTEVIKRFLEVPINFDLTAPGLGLKTGPEDTIEISLDYFFGLGFGLDKDGFFFDTSGVTEEGSEISLALEAAVGAGAALTGQLGFLRMGLTDIVEDDDDGASGLRGEIAVDLQDSGGDGRWHSGEQLKMAARVNAEANVDLYAKLDMDFGSNPIKLPHVETKIHYDQQLADIEWTSDSGSFSTSFFENPEVVFEDVTLDLGGLISGFIAPIAKQLDPFLGDESEVRRVIDLMTMEINLGITKLTLLDLVIPALNAKKAGTGDALKLAIDAIKATSDFIALANDAAEEGGSILINFGTFSLGGSMLTSDSNKIEQDDISPGKGSGGSNEDFKNKAEEQTSGKQKKLVASLGTTEGSIMFPILNDPMTVIGLLTGKDVNLFVYDTPDIDFEFVYEQSFPVFTGLNAVIKGVLTARTDFAFGFDTTGIRSWFEDFEKANWNFAAAAGSLDDIFDGFFIADWAVDDNGNLVEGNDIPEVEFDMSFAAGAALGIGGLVEAGVLGGITAEIDLNLHDLPNDGTGGNTGIEAVYDGKIRFDEIAKIVSVNPLCLFDMEGALKAFLEAYLWVGFKVFGGKVTIFEAEKRFVEATLARFEHVCPDPEPPVVATLDNQGVLTLAYDPAGSKKPGDQKEEYEVALEEVDLTPKDGDPTKTLMIAVRGNGYTQYFDPAKVKTIRSSGSRFDDDFKIDANINADLDIHTGAGNDRITLTGGQQNSPHSRKVFAGDGDDIIIGTILDDYLDGGSGNDRIQALSGNDTLVGGDGNDFIWAASGNNTVNAGAGDDTILTGDGDDIVDAGAGNDKIQTEGGIDRITAGDGNDQIIAGLGADIITGGAGDDALIWEVGDGNDDFDGGAGQDEVLMRGYSFNPDAFYQDDSSDYVQDSGQKDTVRVNAEANGDLNARWTQGGNSASLLSRGVETLSVDTGLGADDIVVGNLMTTAVNNVKVDTGKRQQIVSETRKVKARNDAGELVDTDEEQVFKILKKSDDLAEDRVVIEGSTGDDNYRVSDIESLGTSGTAETALRYEQLNGQQNDLGEDLSHVIVDVYSLESQDDAQLHALAGDDTIDASGVEQAIVSELLLDGGSGDDRIIGSNLAGTADVIIGGAGSDRITGGAGVDRFLEHTTDAGDSNLSGDKDVLIESRDADFVLTDTSLRIDDTVLHNQFGDERETFANIFEDVELKGGAGANKFEIKDWSASGVLDGGTGGDTYKLELASLAQGRQFFNIADTGESGIDTLVFTGSTGNDTIQLDTVYQREQDEKRKFKDDRWNEYGNHGDGLIIGHFDSNDSFDKKDINDEDALMNVSESGLSKGKNYQVINYTSVEQVTVFGGEGDDKFISDSTATQIDVFGNGGDDQFYVGSVLETEDVIVEGQIVTIVKEITDGSNFNNSSFYGGDGDDYFEVNHNVADIGLFGDNGDDTFFIKALLTVDEDGGLAELESKEAKVSGTFGEDSDKGTDTSTDTREVDSDNLVYVENANITIDGGAGFDAVSLVGTVLSDTFYIFVETDPVTGEKIQRIYGAGVKLQKLLNIERLQLLTGGGDDTVYVYGVDMGAIGDMVIKTGSGSDTVHIGGPEQIINLSYPKSSDLYYSVTEGFEVPKDALGKYIRVGDVDGLPFYKVNSVNRVVPFEVETPAFTRQVVVPESRDISAFVSPVTIDGGEGINDQIIVNNQAGSSKIRLSNTDLKKKEVVFDTSKQQLASEAENPANDLVAILLGASGAEGDEARELLAGVVTNYLRFQDRYYDTDLLQTLAGLNGSETREIIVPEGMSYLNLQTTLNDKNEVVTAREQLEDFASKFGLQIKWKIVDHPDPSRAAAGEKLYELQGLTKNGMAVDFEVQHKETVVFEGDGQKVYKNLVAVTLKTSAKLRVTVKAGAVGNITELRSDAYNTLFPTGQFGNIYFGAINTTTLNLSEASASGSELYVDNSLFAGKLYIEGGKYTDRILLKQIDAETIVHGNAGDDEIIVGENGTVDKIGESLYLFGDEGNDSIKLDHSGSTDSSDVTVDKNVLEHSTGFEQLSRITNALSLKDLTDEENSIIEEELKDSSVPYGQDALNVDKSDLEKARDHVAENALDKLKGVVDGLQDELDSAIDKTVQLLKDQDIKLLENQIILYVRAKYYEGSDGKWLRDEIFRRMEQMGVRTYLNYTDYDSGHVDYRSSNKIRAYYGIAAGVDKARSWFEDPKGNFRAVGLGNHADQSLTASHYVDSMRDVLKGKSLYSLFKNLFSGGSKTLGGGKLDEDEHLSLELNADKVSRANFNNILALAKIYDEAMNQYMGSSHIYKNLLQGRGLSQTQLDSLYAAWSTSDGVRGFQWSETNHTGTIIKNAGDVKINLNEQYKKLTKSVELRVEYLEGAYKQHYADQISNLSAAINTALATDDFSASTLDGINSQLKSLLTALDPTTKNAADTKDLLAGTGEVKIEAEAGFIKAPVYNAFATGVGNGLSGLLDAVASLSNKLEKADFNGIQLTPDMDTYAELEQVYSGSGYQGVRDVYADASDLIKEYLGYKSRYIGTDALPADVAGAMSDVRKLDKAADRFDAFVKALNGGFDFNSFRDSFFKTQADIETFVADNPGYTANLLKESRYDAMADSLKADGKDIAEPVATNRMQYNLFNDALTQARKDLAALESELKQTYTVTVKYWWFSQTITLNWKADARYLQQVQLVKNLEQRVAKAALYANASDAQSDKLNNIQDGYEDKADEATAAIDAKRKEYDELKTRINAQFLVLKEVSRFAIDVLKQTRKGQAADGFVDSGSLISDLISFYDEYRILDENTAKTPQQSSVFADRSEDGTREATQSSIILNTDRKDYQDVLSVSGLAAKGIHIGFDDVEKLEINTGQAADDVQVLDSLGQQQAELFINTGAGDDTITATDENKLVSGIVSEVIVDGGSGSNELTIDDFGDQSGDNIVMSNTLRNGYTSVAGISAGNIHFTATAGDFQRGVTLQAGTGNDKIAVQGVLDNSATTILAGAGDDDITVTASAGSNVSLTLKGEAGLDVIDAARSGFGVSIYGDGGNDTLYGSAFADMITGNAGNDLIIAGLGTDNVAGNEGNDIILGDAGSVQDSQGNELTMRAGVIARIETAAGGGDDTITGGIGDDLIIGGAGSDTINDESGTDLVIGDNALITYAAGAVLAASRRPEEGGNDAITLGLGINRIIGGSGDDRITVETASTDYILADNGEFQWVNGAITVARSLDAAAGGNDTVSLGNGSKTVIAGTGNDTVTSGQQGTHRVIGDNGEMLFDAGALRTLRSTDETEGGDDTIRLSGDVNQILGGAGSDEITVSTDTSKDHVLGDNGTMLYRGDAGSESLYNISSKLNTGGGDDRITLGSGDKVVIAGIGNDTVTTTEGTRGTRYVLGDEGEITYDSNNILERAASTSTVGGNDTLILGGQDSNDTNMAIGGVGADSITTSNSTDFILGDNGQMRWQAGQLVQAVSTDASQGGNDTITLGNGSKTVIAGTGNDTVTSGQQGTHRVIGDNGEMVLDAGALRTLRSTDEAESGDDIIHLSGDVNQVIGGAGSDEITVSAGTSKDHVLGDNGTMLYRGDAGSEFLYSMTSTLNTGGGDDRITLGSGDKVVIAGVGNDTVTTTEGTRGTRYVLGDEGEIAYDSNNSLERAASTSTNGGDDTLILGGQDSNDTNVVIGGVGADSITTSDSTDFILGDNGQMRWQDGQLVQVVSTDASQGGNDTITLGNGSKTVIAGTGNDTVTSGQQGTHRVIGDNGEMVLDAGALRTLRSTDEAEGGDDIIRLSGDVNQVIGGAGSDEITVSAGTSKDHVLGDNGTMLYRGDAGSEFLYSMTSTLNTGGGDDRITLGSGDKVVIAGVGNDTVTTTEGTRGSRYVLGDEGEIGYDSNNILERAASTSTNGGNDTLILGGQDSNDTNVVIGGIGADSITTSDSTDFILGDNGQMRWQDGQLVQVVSTDASQGGNDTITLGNGSKTVIAGTGNDTVTSGQQGTHRVIGDNGEMVLDAGALRILRSTDEAEGGDDIIRLSGDVNQVIGGAGSDEITVSAGTSKDHVLGDNGTMLYRGDAGSEFLYSMTSTLDTGGGDDRITLGSGDKVVIAGVGNDTVTTTEGTRGSRYVLGDEGEVGYDSNNILERAVSTSTVGGNDTLILGGQDSNDINVAIGGVGAD